MSTYYKPGCWNVICQVCGVQYKSDEIKKRWDGALVCKDDWEPRNILDFLRPITEREGVPYSNPEPADVFISVPYLQGRQAIAGVAIAGLAITNYTSPNL